MTQNDTHTPRPGCVSVGCQSYRSKPGCGWLGLDFGCCNPRYREAWRAVEAEAEQEEVKDEQSQRH